MTHPDDIGYERAEQRQRAAEDGVMLVDEEEDYYDDNERACWQCHGEGWGIVGLDWDANKPGWDMDGDVQRCPCCGGSGDAKDCTYW